MVHPAVPFLLAGDMCGEVWSRNWAGGRNSNGVQLGCSVVAAVCVVVVWSGTWCQNLRPPSAHALTSTDRSQPVVANSTH